MKIEIIRKALRCYAASAECPNDERADVFDALEALAQTADRYESRDLWQDAVEFIPLPTLIDLLNELTYDDYGRRARKHGNDMRLDLYTYDVRNNHMFAVAGLTDAQLEAGYEVISDLWHDNEANGAHNADGSFNHNA